MYCDNLTNLEEVCYSKCTLWLAIGNLWEKLSMMITILTDITTSKNVGSQIYQ